VARNKNRDDAVVEDRPTSVEDMTVEQLVLEAHTRLTTREVDSSVSHIAERLAAGKLNSALVLLRVGSKT
jgi:hypothetical protein